MLHHPSDSGFQRVATDVIDLFELQWQLLSVDGEEAKRRAIKAGVFGALALVVAFASMCGLVLGVGWLLHEQFNWSVSTGLLVTSGIGFVLASIAGLIGAILVGKASQSLAETKSEFAENMRWIKSVIAMILLTKPTRHLNHKDRNNVKYERTSE